MGLSKKQLMIILAVGALCYSSIQYFEKAEIVQPVNYALDALRATSDSDDTSLDMTNTDTKVTPSKTTPKIDAMNYDQASFIINEPVNLSLTLSETKNKDTDRNYYLEIYSSRAFGEFLLASSDVTIKSGSDKLNKSFKVSFDTPGDIYTLIKIYDKKGGTLLLEEKSTVKRMAEYVITSDTKLNGLDTCTALNSSICKQFKSKGTSFVVRYYSNNDAKCLTKKEAKLINDAGMQLVVVYQDSNNKSSYFTYNNGVADCKLAIEKAIEIGQPTTTPIYFAVDFEANSSTIGNVYNYFDGVNTTMSEFRESDSSGRFWQVGGYGSYYVVKSLKESDRISYVWQTYGWSYDKYYSYNMYQKTHAVEVAGVVTDENVSNTKKNNNVGGFYIKQ